jgi:hypothetical protein
MKNRNAILAFLGDALHGLIPILVFIGGTAEA